MRSLANVIDISSRKAQGDAAVLKGRGGDRLVARQLQRFAADKFARVGVAFRWAWASHG